MRANVHGRPEEDASGIDGGGLDRRLGSASAMGD